jgi:hypothetical protein
VAERPVLGPEDLAREVARWRREGLVLLGASALRGARERIGHILTGLRLREGGDFLMLAQGAMIRGRSSRNQE